MESGATALRTGCAGIFQWCPSCTSSSNFSLVSPVPRTVIQTAQLDKYKSTVLISGLVTFIAGAMEMGAPQLTGVPFNDAYRYMDWLWTVPLLLIEILWMMNLPGFGCALMITSGYVALASMIATTMHPWFRPFADTSGLATFIAACHFIRIFNSWANATSDWQYRAVYNVLPLAWASMMATTMYFWFRSFAVISGLVTFIAAYHYIRIFNFWDKADDYKPGKIGDSAMEMGAPQLTAVSRVSRENKLPCKNPKIAINSYDNKAKQKQIEIQYKCNGNLRTLQVQLEFCTWQVKNLIQLRDEIPVLDQVLSFQGKRLVDGRSLA